MGEITLRSDSQTSVTSVSNIFIDEYMADANGEFVKIYLYLLRLMNEPAPAFSISSIADKFEHTEKDVKRALSYWERMQLLRLEYDEKQNLTGVCLLDSINQPQKAAAGKAQTAPVDSPAGKAETSPVDSPAGKAETSPVDSSARETEASPAPAKKAVFSG